MAASDWKNNLNNQLKTKPQLKKRYLKYCKPKERKYGMAVRKCEICGRFGARVGSYGINMCRQCFREVAEEIGFKKYS